MTTITLYLEKFKITPIIKSLTNISKQKKEIQNLFHLYHQCLILNGAKGGTRTHTPKAPDPKSGASANSATLANGEPYWNRTSDTMIKSHVLYRLS